VKAAPAARPARVERPHFVAKLAIVSETRRKKRSGVRPESAVHHLVVEVATVAPEDTVATACDRVRCLPSAVGPGQVYVLDAQRRPLGTIVIAKSLFLGPLADSDKWEIRLQVVRALPLLKWTPREGKRVIDILTRDIEHPQKFVRAWTLDSLASFARIHGAVTPTVERGLGRFERSGSKALQARARQIRERMVRHRPE
jgi:hypothetical protein